MATAHIKAFTQYLIDLGIDQVPHSGKSFLAHLVNVYRLMESRGCSEELCRAGMFHSIYGTQQFQAFKLDTDRRAEVQALIGDRAEWLAYLNCAIDRPSFDAALTRADVPFRFIDRITGTEVELGRADFDDLCRVHLYDWIEQVPRSRLGWDYRRGAYRALADRLGGAALTAYEEAFAAEPARATTELASEKA